MKFKKIDTAEKVFYVFETSNITFSIFDSQLNAPIYYGSWNMCEGIIRNIKKHSPEASIFFYAKEKSGLLTESPLWSHYA